MSFFACGETWENKFFYLLPCQDKQTYYMELIRDRMKLGRFCYNCGRALVRARILLVPQVPGPALGSVQAGNAWNACTRLCTRSPKTMLLTPKYLVSVAFA